MNTRLVDESGNVLRPRVHQSSLCEGVRGLEDVGSLEVWWLHFGRGCYVVGWMPKHHRTTMYYGVGYQLVDVINTLLAPESGAPPTAQGPMFTLILSWPSLLPVELVTLLHIRTASESNHSQWRSYFRTRSTTCHRRHLRKFVKACDKWRDSWRRYVSHDQQQPTNDIQ